MTIRELAKRVMVVRDLEVSDTALRNSFSPELAVKSFDEAIVWRLQGREKSSVTCLE